MIGRSKHMPKHYPLLTIILTLAVGAIASTAISEEASPPLGENLLTEFQVKDVTGPAAGKTLCYYCRYGRRPVICVFTREVNDEVAQLIARIDAAVDANSQHRWAAFVVFLGEDSQAAEQRLKALARNHKIRHTPLTIYRDTPQKLDSGLHIADQTRVLLRCWRNGKVPGQSDFSSENPATEIDRLLADLAR